MSGWIYDFRRELESNIWLMPPLYHRVWQWIKYSVNHARVDIPNKDGSTTTIYPGQRATSYRQIAKGVGYYEGKKWKEPNVKTIKSILDWMAKQNMISVECNTEGTIITVEKWELYQSELVKGNTKRITPATRQKHDLDTNNKGLINDELMNKKDYDVFFQSCWLMYPRKEGKGKISDKTKKERFELGDEFIRCIERYKTKLKRDNTEIKFIMHGSTFWNSGYVDYLDSTQDKPKELSPLKIVDREIV